MNNIKIGDSLWHPCSIDIIEHKVIGIHKFEVEYLKGSKTKIQYTTKARYNVGACGRVEVILSENNGVLRFIELVNEDDIEHSSGLQDFIEGFYYTNKSQAELDYYTQQETLCRSNMDSKRRIYEEANRSYERVKKLVKDLKEKINHV